MNYVMRNLARAQPNLHSYANYVSCRSIGFLVIINVNHAIRLLRLPFSVACSISLNFFVFGQQEAIFTSVVESLHYVCFGADSITSCAIVVNFDLNFDVIMPLFYRGKEVRRNTRIDPADALEMCMDSDSELDVELAQMNI